MTAVPLALACGVTVLCYAVLQPGAGSLALVPIGQWAWARRRPTAQVNTAVRLIAATAVLVGTTVTAITHSLLFLAIPDVRPLVLAHLTHLAVALTAARK
jgi:hypothetical protein